MFGLGPTELMVILVIVLVLFGGAKLPKLARSLGQAKNEFEAGTKEGMSEAEKEELKREQLREELKAELKAEELKKKSS
jgi:sec-independent protein translocase protein TatA